MNKGKKTRKKRKHSKKSVIEEVELKLEAQERLSEINRKREKEALQAQKNEELRIREHQLREERLKPICAMLSALSHKKYEHDLMYRDELNWKHIIECNGTPNPRILQELNTYLYFEKQINYDNENWNSYEDKCLEIFNIMDAVDDIVDLPLNFNQFKLQCFREIRDNLGRLLVEIVYGACYHLLNDYDSRMDPADDKLETVAYQNSCEAFAVGLHVVCHRPRLETDDRPPPKCDFTNSLVMVDVPPQLSQQYMAIMALWLRWDPFTNRMAEFDVSESLESDTRDLWQYSEDIWEEHNQISEKFNEEKEQTKMELWFTEMEEKPNELNLRRCWIIGGAFNVEMWKLPVQPVENRDGSVVVMLESPATLKPIDYFEKYDPLQLSVHFSSTSSEVEETNFKKQNQETLNRLTLINIKLPENVLWFENPKPAIWSEEKKIWTTDHIHDVRFDEEKQTVSFRAGRMGSFGLAVNRYSNFPFQSWELRPEGSGPDTGVVLSVTAAAVLVEFAVRGDHAAMVQLQNATTAALQEMIGVYHRPHRLVRLLRRGGVNLFPEPDAVHYVDGHRPPKHAVVERHTYRCMAALSGTHQFTASRWNGHAATDRIVMQMREIPVDEAAAAGGSDATAVADTVVDCSSAGGGAGVPFDTVMVTPERALVLECNECSETFSEEPLNADGDAPFAPDLFTLAADAASTDRVRAALADVRDFKTVQTLYYLLDKIRFLSYS